MSSVQVQRLATPTMLLSALLLASPAALSSQAPADDRAAVLAVADSALAAVTRSDFVGLTELMLDSAVTFSARERNGQIGLRFETRAQMRAVPAGGNYVERGFRPLVHISGPLAVVWLPYDFYLDGNWSHCGVDAFTLLKAEGRWRIATLVWSVEQPPACEPHPDGPPPGMSPPGAP
ncbi:MAG: hypothetical protein OEV95_06125 [Gemmatimonadota bacterium]|nr:hypothetical protein [Gemmatimonadota bacterium]MDH5283621.1 hypothetical protein [Gemmatimonadota bacterium]